MEWFVWNDRTELPNNCLWCHCHWFGQRKRLENFKTFVFENAVLNCWCAFCPWFSIYCLVIVGEVLAEIYSFDGLKVDSIKCLYTTAVVQRLSTSSSILFVFQVNDLYCHSMSITCDSIVGLLWGDDFERVPIVSFKVKLSKRHRMVEITASECVLGGIFVCSLKRIKTRHNIVWRYQDKMRNVVRILSIFIILARTIGMLRELPHFWSFLEPLLPKEVEQTPANCNPILTCKPLWGNAMLSTFFILLLTLYIFACLGEPSKVVLRGRWVHTIPFYGWHLLWILLASILPRCDSKLFFSKALRTTYVLNFKYTRHGKIVMASSRTMACSSFCLQMFTGNQ